MSGNPATTADAAAASGDAYGASGTSCYTTEEKKDSYSTLSKILETKCTDGLVRQVILDMMDVCAEITDALRVNLVTVEGSSNVFGDSQLSVDVRCKKKSCRTRKIASALPSAGITSKYRVSEVVIECCEDRRLILANPNSANGNIFFFLTFFKQTNKRIHLM